MKIYIKNMVCIGTKDFVVQELESMGINYKKFELSEIELEDDLTLPEIKRLDHAFRQYGLEVVFEKSKIVSQIRNTINDLIENNLILKSGLSNYVSNKVGYNYYYLNSYFFKETGLAIEEYYVSRQEDNIRERMKRNALVRSLS
jgi:AraC family transcriptional regulator